MTGCRSVHVYRERHECRELPQQQSKLIVAESPLSRNEIWYFFLRERYIKSPCIRTTRKIPPTYISSFFFFIIIIKYFPDTTARLLSSDGNKNIVNLLLPRGRFDGRELSERGVSRKPSLYTYRYILALTVNIVWVSSCLF